MNKIPELTQEQIASLDYSDGYSHRDVKEVANNIYLDCLKIADQQGLLTKEASLALKPDNYIHWECIENPPPHLKSVHIGTNKFVSIALHERDTHCVIYIDEFLNGISVYEGDVGVIGILQAGKQYCQNWLDEKVKEANNE